MKIVDHRLQLDDGAPVAFRPSPNHGGALTPDTLVIHFTAGRTANGSVQWLTNPRARASAHVVIAEDGGLTQLVPFNVIAWHAGRSTWKGRDGLNRYAIGIELANPGNLKRTGSKWRTWFGTEVDSDEVLVARHKNEEVEQGWKVFPTQQLDAALELGILLVSTYGLGEVVGHDDIAPGRKIDPGPAFPIDRYRGLLLGRAEESGLPVA